MPYPVFESVAVKRLERPEGPGFVMLRKGSRLTNSRLSDQTVILLV